MPHAGGWGWVNSKAGRAPESGAPVPSDGQYAQETWPAVEKDHAAVITYLDVRQLSGSVSAISGRSELLLFVFRRVKYHAEPSSTPSPCFALVLSS